MTETIRPRIWAVNTVKRRSEGNLKNEKYDVVQEFEINLIFLTTSKFGTKTFG